MVRMWSISPRFYDRKALGGAWREAIQCKAILEENRLTGGYVVHPQLDRFRPSNQLHEPHMNFHMNWYLHTLYHEATHARNYKYNTNFIGPHHPYGCLDCSSVETAEHAIFPLNSFHTPTTYQLSRPHYYTPSKFRYSLHYPDTIVRDNVTNFPIYRDLATELSPSLIHTPRNVIEFSNTNSLSQTTQRIIRLEPIISPVFEINPMTLQTVLSANEADTVVPIFSTATSARSNLPNLPLGMQSSTSFVHKIGRALKVDATSTSTTTTTTTANTTATKPAARGKRGKKAKKDDSDDSADEPAPSIADASVAPESTLFSFPVPSIINKPTLAPPYTVTWPNLQTQLNTLATTHAARFPSRAELQSRFAAENPPPLVIPTTSGPSTTTKTVVPDIQHQYLPHTPLVPTTASTSTSTSTTAAPTPKQLAVDYWNSMPISYKSIPVTLGQVLYEWIHLLNRMKNDGRDPAHSDLLKSIYIDINYHTDPSTTTATNSGSTTTTTTSTTTANDNNNQQMDPKLLQSYNSPSFLSHDQITDAAQLYTEKHPYTTQFESYGLPTWLNIHHPEHVEAFENFHNFPAALQGRQLDCSIPGYHPVSGTSTGSRDAPAGGDMGDDDQGASGNSGATPTTKATKGKNKRIASALDSSPSTESVTIEANTEDSSPKPKTTKKPRKNGKKDEDETLNQLVSLDISSTTTTPVTSTKSPKQGSNTRLTKSLEAETLYTSQKSTLSQIQLLSSIPKDAKVLHINDIIHPLFYVVDGDIEYTEVVGEYNLGDLKLFKGL